MGIAIGSDVGVDQQAPTRFGGHDTAWKPVEQPGLQLPLQGLNLRGDRRLNVAQLSSRGGEAARPDHSLERPQQLRLHRLPLIGHADRCH